MRRKDERGSLPLALLVITFGLSMSAALAPVVVQQIKTTQGTVDRNVQLNAAQVGLDALMAQVRAAAEGTSSDRSGLLENLPPCVIKGNAGAGKAGESIGWKVTIVYRDQDGGALSCPLTKVPAIAELTSDGTGSKGTRTLTAKYIFRTDNTNIPGGAIRIDTTSGGVGKLCLDAGDETTLTAGRKVWMMPCNGSSAQQFGYTAELFLKLINSDIGGSSYSNGLCLNPGETRSGNNDLYITFQPCPDPKQIDPDECTTPKTCAFEFQWALDGSSRFRSTDVNNQKTESYCMTMQTPSMQKSLVVLSNKACSGDGTNVIWRSDPTVGAGMAGDKTNQLVNYAQFSRCLDVTNQSVTSTYMIAWFCKQAPDTKIDWNQQWYHTAPTPPATSATNIIEVYKEGKRYCLKSPLNAASNAYTTVVSCPPGSDTSAKDLQWTIFHDTGKYATSYRIQDNAGFCLTPTDLNATVKDTHTDGTSKVKVAVCSSSELQKWNAPADIGKASPLTDIREK